MSGGILIPSSVDSHLLSSTPQSRAFPSTITSSGLSTFARQQPIDSYTTSNMSSRKRKADDDLQDEAMTRPSTSPSPSPSTPTRHNHQRYRPIKKPRTSWAAGPLPLSRLLETLNPDQLRSVLRSICDEHPQIGTRIVSAAPKPTVQSALTILSDYQAKLRTAFPYGDRPSSDYAYNRVRHALTEMLDALRDYTPNFLPPQEPQPSLSLAYLDGVTNIIHQLPEWDTYQHNRHKHDAYEEIAQAWALALREAAKKGGGIQLQISGWDQKLSRHNTQSGDRLQPAIQELRASLGWIDGTATGRMPQDRPDDASSIRQQLMAGTYGAANPIQVGPW